MIRHLFALLCLCLASPVFAQEATWKGGFGTVNITPTRFMWMSGYGSRTAPADGKETDLWAKAMVLQAPDGKKLVLVTLDLVGIDRGLSQSTCKLITEAHKVPREAIALSVSHTHCGPVVGTNLRSMYFFDDEQAKLVEDYAAKLPGLILKAVDTAVANLEPVKLTSSVGTAGFAVNRRENKEAEVPTLIAKGELKGPIDHDVPVIAAHDAKGKLKGIDFGYACHATVMAYQKWSGDYPGFAMIELEKQHPGAVAMFFAGCGGDQNPLPRRMVELAKDYGKQLATAVDAVLAKPMTAITPEFATVYQEIELPLAEVPSREAFVKESMSEDKFIAARAKMLLKKIEAGEKIPDAYPYPVQAWRLGKDLALVMLGGEVVVDYSLRLKKELGPNLWVMGYANDVMAYIPSARILKEGGYEGGGAMVYYGLPAVWRPKVEELIVDEVSKQVKQVKKPADPFPVTELPKIKPLEPAEAQKAFDVRPGFHVELVAAEPLLRSPVAMDFDENGRLFVAEFPEYNQYANPNGSKERGCIRMLESTKGDGKYDKSTVYVADLDSPVAVACWDGGVFVGVVPDLWYFKDTKGDGKVDVKRKVLTGFERDKAGEAMLNSFRWGPDNRFHIATGFAGGNLRAADKPDAKPVLVRRQNILFDPRTSTFEPTSGGGQHGMSLDDWGETFICANSDPIQHLAYDMRYATRNPFVVAPSPIVDINAAGRYPNLHRISPPEPWREVRTRLRKDKLVPGSDEGGQPFGFFTGATGVTVYRGDAFPPEFQGNIFVGEVANNLVYRAKVEAKGLGWNAVRAEKDREFLASKDVWFRPVQFANAPDGCLYVIDMYRELIEGAAFLPPELLKLVDVSGGIDRGRIWRIVPDGFKQPKLPQLGKASTAELVALLEHPNGWHRDTAARLLYERQDKDAVPALRKLAAESKVPLARMHALYALHGLKALTSGQVIPAIEDDDPRVREHALRLAEGFGLSAGMAKRFEDRVNDIDPRVRLQLAFTLGSFKQQSAIHQLADIAMKESADPWFRLAVLCSAGDRGGAIFARIIANVDWHKTPGVKGLTLALVGQIAAANRPEEVVELILALDALPEAEKPLARELVQAFITKLPPAAREKFAGLAGGKAAAILKDLLADARKTATDDKAEPAARAAAIRTLGLAPFADVKALLTASLGVRQPQPVQLAALEVLAKFDSADVPTMVLSQWQSMSPRIRATATETLLSRTSGINAFLDAVEKGTVPRTDLDPARVQLLQKSADEKIRARAVKLFAGTAPSKRQDVIAKYQKSLELKGDAAKGKLLFKEVCASCHKLESVGEAIGPDLNSIKNRGLESVLTNILDPNREVLPQYYSYLLVTDDDTIITGMITAETANTVTIRKTDGMSETVQRVNIASLRSTGLSAMPEGLEDKISLQAMADLLAYLNSIR